MTTEENSKVQQPSGGEGKSPPETDTPLTVINLPANPELENPEKFGAATKEAEKDAPPPTAQDLSAAGFEEKPYNADESRDATRQTITLWLIGLLCTIVGLTFVALFARGASSGFSDSSFFQELKQVLDVLVGPIITLLASAIGFYFGYKQGELGEQARNNKAPKA